MQPLLVTGLVLALGGAPAILAIVRVGRLDPLGWRPRLGFWLLAGVVVALACGGAANGLDLLGWRPPSGTTLAFALVGALAAFLAWPLVQLGQRWLGGTAVHQTETFKKLVGVPLPYRIFLVLTAGVTEEILYRGYGIGVGSEILGSGRVAVALSLCCFVAAHFRWGAGHLVSVCWAGLVLSVLFVLSRDLVACIVAHTLIDTVGLIIAPWGLERRARQEGPPATGSSS
jgi:membrane protease YdiL (CAAX protease family)